MLWNPTIGASIGEPCALTVMDLINQLVQVLKKELVQLKDSVQELKEVGGLDLVKL